MFLASQLQRHQHILAHKRAQFLGRVPCRAEVRGEYFVFKLLHKCHTQIGSIRPLVSQKASMSDQTIWEAFILQRLHKGSTQEDISFNAFAEQRMALSCVSSSRRAREAGMCHSSCKPLCSK